MWDMIGMSLSHCTVGMNGVGTGLSRVCVELLTPVTAACFDVYFNVVLCCSLFVYILIKKRNIINCKLHTLRCQRHQVIFSTKAQKNRKRTAVPHLPRLSLLPFLSTALASPLPETSRRRLPNIIIIALGNDPLKRDRRITTVSRRATQSCEILSVWALLAQITCPLDVFWTWMTHGPTQPRRPRWRVNVRRRTWCVRCERDRRDGGQGRVHFFPVPVCVCVYVYSEGNKCAEAASGGLLHLVIEAMCSVMRH